MGVAIMSPSALNSVERFAIHRVRSRIKAGNFATADHGVVQRDCIHRSVSSSHHFHFEKGALAETQIRPFTMDSTASRYAEEFRTGQKAE